MRVGAIVFILALAFLSAQPSRAEPNVAATVAHGSDINDKNVGPAAIGSKAETLITDKATGTIKAGQIPSYARLVPDATSYDGISVPGPHLLIENITLEFPLDIYTPLPVVMRGVYILVRAGGHWGVHTRPGSGPVYVLWSQIGGGAFEVQTGLMLRGGPAIIYRSRIKLAGDGIHADTPNIRIEENLIDGLVARQGSHNDAIQIAPGIENVVIGRNRILNSNPQTSCIFNEGNNVTIEDNYLSGGGWVIYGGAASNGHRKDGGGSKGVSVSGNVFGLDTFAKSGNFGVVAYWDRANFWNNNRFSDGRAVEP